MKEAAAAAELKTINPATEEVIDQYKIITKEQINDKVRKAQNAFQDWKKDANKRTDLLHDFADELRKNKENLARIATNEMGKAIKESRSEVEKCAWVMEYYADNGTIFTTDEVINTDARKTHKSSAYWSNREYNAMEFSLLAGAKVCSSFLDS